MKVIKFGTSTCGPCRLQHKEFEDNPLNVPLEEVDMDKPNEKDYSKFTIRGVPTIVLLSDDDVELNRWTGFTKSEVINSYIDAVKNTVPSRGE